MKQQIIADLEALADKYGAEELTEVATAIYGTNGNGETGPTACPQGYVWSSRLKRCVADIG